jgi:transposase
MFKIMDLLKLHFDAKESNEQIAVSLKISKGSVFRYLEIIKKKGIVWPLDSSFDEKKIMELFKKKRENIFKDEKIPNWSEIEKELSQPHVTRYLLWEEYKKKCPDGLSKSSFYEKLRFHQKENDVDYRVPHKAGEKLYIDYSGDSINIYDRLSNKSIKTQLFICTWGLSNYCYVEFSLSQQISAWIKSHVNAFNFFNCTPKYLVPDNLKSAVLLANYYDPDLNPTYNQLANHYNTCVIPGRSRKPKDKAIVENHVLIIQRFILGRLRGMKFFSIPELNEAAMKLLEEFNAKSFQKKEDSRKELFETIDRPNARALPLKSFEFINIETNIAINKNYHVLYQKHYYSVPFIYYKGGRQRVRVFENANCVEIYIGQERLAMHQKSNSKYEYTTNELHMPKNHLFFASQNKQNLIQKAFDIGPSVGCIAESLLSQPWAYEKYYRMVLGIIKLKNEYPNERVNRAAKIVLDFEGSNYKLIKNILKMNLDAEENQSSVAEVLKQINHENIRGQEAYKIFQ